MREVGANRESRSIAGTPELRGAGVDQHDVGAQVNDQLKRVVCVGGFADEVEPAARQRLGQGAADHLLVVDHDDGDRPRALRRVLLRGDVAPLIPRDRRHGANLPRRRRR